MNLTYRRRVGYELNAITQWYEEQREGFGEEFLAEFDALIRVIDESPKTFALIDDKVRRAGMTRFPYNVFYQIEKKRIVILAVVHSSRHQSNWPQSRKRSH
jgi:toxin ParE1/3/4